MALVDRARNILLSPRSEWNVIAAESAATGPLISGYVVPLAAASALAGLVGSLLFGAAMSALIGVGPTFIGAIVGALIGLVLSIVAVYVLSIIINLFAPTFGGQKNEVQALKVAAYSTTAV